MCDEAISTFEYLVREGRPVKEILRRLRVPEQAAGEVLRDRADVPSEDALVKVDGADAFNRGGALRLGSVLTTTSAPLRTSPVKRGDWVLRRVLGTPTPPPPGDAGTLPGDDKSFNGLTLRERLAEHKRNARAPRATCASIRWASRSRASTVGRPRRRMPTASRRRHR